MGDKKVYGEYRYKFREGVKKLSFSHNDTDAPISGTPDPRVDVKYTGDINEASKWRNYAFKKLAQLRQQKGLRVFTQITKPKDGVTVRVQRRGEGGSIRIHAEVGFSFYAFMATERYYSDEFGDVEYLDENPNALDRFIEGYEVVAVPERGYARPNGRHFTHEDEEDRPKTLSVDSGGGTGIFRFRPVSDQNRAVDNWYQKGTNRLVISNRSANRYVRSMPIPCSFSAGVATHECPVRDYGVNVPPLVYPKFTTHPGNVSFPNPSNALSDDFHGFEVRSLPYTQAFLPFRANKQILVRSTYEYFQNACLIKASNTGREFVLLNVEGGKKLYAYPVQNVFPQAPASLASINIPFPSWAHPNQPGFLEENNWLTWQFRNDGKRMAAVLFSYEDAYHPLYKEGGFWQNARAATLVNGYDYPPNENTFFYPFLGSKFQLYDNSQIDYPDDAVISPPRDIAATFSELYDSDTKHCPLYDMQPGIVEFEIDLVDNGDSAPTISLTKTLDEYGPNVGRCYYAVDYHIDSGRMVTAELEAFYEGGNILSRANEGTRGYIFASSQRSCATKLHYDLVLGYHTKKEDEETPVVTRLPVFHGFAWGSDRNAIGTSRIHTLYSSFRSAVSAGNDGAVGAAGYPDQDRFYNLTIKGLDLRNFSVYGHAINSRFITFQYGAIFNRQGARIKSLIGEPLSAEYVKVSRPSVGGDPPHVAEFDLPTSTGLTKVDPCNYLSMSVMHAIFNSYALGQRPIFGDISVGPQKRAAYFDLSSLDVGHMGIYYTSPPPGLQPFVNNQTVRVISDEVRVGNKRTTHEELYAKARASSPDDQPFPEITRSTVCNGAFRYQDASFSAVNNNDPNYNPYVDPDDPTLTEFDLRTIPAHPRDGQPYTWDSGGALNVDGPGRIYTMEKYMKIVAALRAYGYFFFDRSPILMARGHKYPHVDA